MSEQTTFNRRKILRAGVASTAALAVGSPAAFAEQPGEIPKKAAGETRVLFLGGDRLHNYYAQEPALRNIAEQAGWNFLSTHDARSLTPELVATADLLMIERYGGGRAGARGEGWVPGPVNTKAPTGDGYMSSELEAVIVENVTVRGMAYMSIHCGIWALTRPKYLDMLGIRPIIHGPLQTVRCQHFNQDHPISRGMQPFDIALDENFGIEPLDSRTIPLYEVYGHQDKRQDYGGWCTEKSKGRVVGLLAGHTYFAFQNPNYLRLFRRSMHWVLRKDIPADS
jgi:hypothetical protein